MSALVRLLASSVAVCGFVGAVDAADLPVPHRHAGTAIGGPVVLDAIPARSYASVGNVPVATPAGHVLAARARFSEARALMERAILLRDRAFKADINALEGHMAALFSELNAVERTHQSRAENVRIALSLAREWRQDGMKIVNPPAEGLLELPVPMSVMRKAEAVSRAIDQLAENAAVDIPAQQKMHVSQRRSAKALEPSRLTGNPN
jgi:hypothetical protein